MHPSFISVNIGKTTIAVVFLWVDKKRIVEIVVIWGDSTRLIMISMACSMDTDGMMESGAESSRQLTFSFSHQLDTYTMYKVFFETDIINIGVHN